MLLGLQNRILRMVAQGDELEATLVTLCLEVEQLLPGSYASILTLDELGFLHPCAAPSLPGDYSTALDGLPIGSTVGSCGSAAFLREAVGVSDIEHDPRWAAFKSLALPLGLRACFSSPIFGSKGKVLGTFALYLGEARALTPFEQSVAEGCLPLCMIALERYERLLEHRRLAFTDVLTGLPNRAKFNDVLLKVPGDIEWSLLLIDVDNLKTVNDTFGHAAGDELISTVASRLSAAIKPLPAYRLGGDEFAVILDRASKRDAGQVAAAIIEAISQPAVCAGHSAFPTVTIGIAHFEDGLSVADTRHHADMALYHAKEVNRGGFTVYDAAMASAISKRTQAIQRVAMALQQNCIEAWYQPIVRIDTGEIVGVEALARMRLDDGTVLPAADFHEATKDAQVAASLTRQMIRCIARDVGSWLRLEIPFQHVGINLSAADFSCSDLPKSLEIAFAREHIPLKHAILEVTESVYLGGRDQRVAKKISSLRASGLKVALDDFGTGFASLTHLITVPVDIIKIDKSFIDRLAPEDVGTGIVEGILHIAKRLGVRVVAEGIETVTQANMLLERGCLLGQGYLYSKALPASEMTMLLQKRAQRQYVEQIAASSIAEAARNS
ncbi:EAL domain-containing protein [Agrobacterium vitis]|uniref:sensor domain-containing phosphodiesterase n=1 Tax=Agrobacterium vitis TaxID=373 RepID=UPI0012E71691|nr:EAL domain-containing protein [Agrobacterium vitis]MUZ65054.1 EAL domain-containing protein [Agrobacterium vitis]